MTDLEFSEYIKYRNIKNQRQICLLKIYNKMGGVFAPLATPNDVMKKVNEVKMKTNKPWWDITGHYDNGILFIYDTEKTYTTFIKMEHIEKTPITDGAEYWEGKIFAWQEQD